MGVIFGQTANRRGGLGFQGQVDSYFSYGVIQGAVNQNMELILLRFGSKVVKAVDAQTSVSWPGTIGVSYLPHSMYRLWQLILNLVRLLRVSVSFTEERLFSW